MRDSFVLYVKYLDNIELLSMEQRGILITALMKYVLGRELPGMDEVTYMAFSFIRAQLDRDFEKYDEICRKRAEAGKLGGRPKKQEEPEKTEGFSEKQTKAKGFSEKQKNPDNDNEYDNDLKENTLKSVKEKFRPPTADEVRAYCSERGNSVDPQAFVDFYESKGWMIGKNRMKDWKAAVRTWERSETKTRQEGTAKLAKDNNNFDRRQYDMDDLERRLIGGK